MIPPRAKSLIVLEAQKYAGLLKTFKNSNPVIMLGELKLDRIDHKILRESQKLNNREINKDVKTQGTDRRYEKRKAAITYRSYSVQFKRRLIQKIRCQSLLYPNQLSKLIRSSARELQIHPKNIFRWFYTPQIKKKQGGRKALYPQMEERLAQFIISNPKMKRKHILRQAKQIMEELRIDGREYFNFSKGWYQRFRQRLVRSKIGNSKVKIERHERQDDYQNDAESWIQGAIKKQQYFKHQYQLKQEYDQQDYVKQQYNQYKSQDQVGVDSDQIEYKSQDQVGQDNTHMNVDQFIIIYDDIIKQQKHQNQIKLQKKQRKTKKQIKEETEKKSKTQLKEEKLQQSVKQEARTNTSGKNSQNQQSFDLSKDAEQLSIFASDDQIAIECKQISIPIVMKQCEIPIESNLDEIPTKQ